MDIFLQSAVLVVTLLVLLGLGIWVGVALMASGVVIFLMFTSTPVDAILGTTMWAHSASWTLTALPLFIWMGEILYRTRLAEDLFSGLVPVFVSHFEHPHRAVIDAVEVVAVSELQRVLQ